MYGLVSHLVFKKVLFNIVEVYTCWYYQFLSRTAIISRTATVASCDVTVLGRVERRYELLRPIIPLLGVSVFLSRACALQKLFTWRGWGEIIDEGIDTLAWHSPTEALRYGTRFQGITQFYLTTNVFIREQNEPYLLLPCIPAESDRHFPTPEGWKAELA